MTWTYFVHDCVCVCVCVRERERAMTQTLDTNHNTWEIILHIQALPRKGGIKKKLGGPDWGDVATVLSDLYLDRPHLPLSPLPVCLVSF